MIRAKRFWINEPENNNARDHCCRFLIHIHMDEFCPGAAVDAKEGYGLGWAGRRTGASQAAADRSQREVRSTRFLRSLETDDRPIPHRWPHDDGLGQSSSSNRVG